VAVDDRLTVREPSQQAGLAPCPYSRVVHEGNPLSANLHDQLRRQGFAERGLVDVSGHGLDRRTQELQLREKRG
jgi:hypothetical protein